MLSATSGQVPTSCRSGRVPVNPGTRVGGLLCARGILFNQDDFSAETMVIPLKDFSSRLLEIQ